MGGARSVHLPGYHNASFGQIPQKLPYRGALPAPPPPARHPLQSNSTCHQCDISRASYIAWFLQMGINTGVRQNWSTHEEGHVQGFHDMFHDP